MKRIAILITTLILVFSLASCDGVCVGPECITSTEGEGTVALENVLPYTHVNGHGTETDKSAYILYEWAGSTYVRYQIAYLACTCRPAVNNYYSVAFVEVNIGTNDIKSITYGSAEGEEGHYFSGVWGDSQEIKNENDNVILVFQDYKDNFLPWLIGKSLSDFEGISVFSNEAYYDIPANTTHIDEQNLIDAFAGGSVSTNNMIRVFKELLQYHENKYA